MNVMQLFDDSLFFTYQTSKCCVKKKKKGKKKQKTKWDAAYW